jgi:hypothetical protein
LASQAALMLKASPGACSYACISQKRVLYSLTAVSCEAASQAW